MNTNVIGAGFRLFKTFNPYSINGKIKVSSDTVGNTIFTVLRDFDGNIIAQRAKTIERNGSSIKITKKLTMVDDRQALLDGKPVKYKDSVFCHTKLADNSKEEMVWLNGRAPVTLNSDNLAHQMDLVQTGHLTRYADGSISGVPNGFEYTIPRFTDI